MTDPFSEESFISTKFYMKKVKKAMIHKDALLLVLEDMNETATPMYSQFYLVLIFVKG
jgi:hypothetical protein